MINKEIGLLFNIYYLITSNLLSNIIYIKHVHVELMLTKYIKRIELV